MPPLTKSTAAINLYAKRMVDEGRTLELPESGLIAMVSGQHKKPTHKSRLRKRYYYTKTILYHIWHVQVHQVSCGTPPA